MRTHTHTHVHAACPLNRTLAQVPLAMAACCDNICLVSRQPVLLWRLWHTLSHRASHCHQSEREICSVAGSMNLQHLPKKFSQVSESDSMSIFIAVVAPSLLCLLQFFLQLIYVVPLALFGILCAASKFSQRLHVWFFRTFSH